MCREQGGASSVANCVLHPIHNHADGGFDLDELSKTVRQLNDDHWADTRLVCLENTHGGCGGAVLPPSFVQQTVQICHTNNSVVHLDGARLFNASVATNTPVSHLAQGLDSVTICLSKGLGAPMGSLLSGSSHFIERAKRARKLLGGALRQAGIVAAAGLEALETYVPQILEDHRRAQLLASGLVTMPHVELGPLVGTRTNMVFFRVGAESRDQAMVCEHLSAKGVGVLEVDGWIRAVTHRHVDDQAIASALSVISQL